MELKYEIQRMQLDETSIKHGLYQIVNNQMSLIHERVIDLEEEAIQQSLKDLG